MRLFLALPLPPDVRHRLAARVAAVAGIDDAVRWVAEDQFHATMKFLGDVADDRLPAIVGAMPAMVAGARPFPVDLHGFGSFPPARPPRVLFAGIEPAPPLELLQDQVERATHALGFALEGQPFRPHVTVGRVRRGRSAGRTAARLADAEHADTFVADRLTLFESMPGRRGPQYVERHVVSLER